MQMAIFYYLLLPSLTLLNGDHFRLHDEEEEEVEEDEAMEGEESDDDDDEKGDADGDDEVDSNEQMEAGVEEKGPDEVDLTEERSEGPARWTSQACRLGGGRMYVRRTSSS